MTNSHFAKAIIREIYLDDGLVVFKGHQTPRQIRQWLKQFQQSINNITGVLTFNSPLKCGIRQCKASAKSALDWRP
eukprot:2105032-Ditylum_brightwellii.AAC.1